MEITKEMIEAAANVLGEYTDEIDQCRLFIAQMVLEAARAVHNRKSTDRISRLVEFID